MFFVQRSQHFNQSDFGILFPFLARRFTKAEEPERILELNTRAMVQTMREAGIEVAGDNDPEILKEESNIRSWMPIHNEDGQRTEDNSEALEAVNGKLSTIAPEHNAAPADVAVAG